MNKCLIDYVPMEDLVYFGFNYSELSTIINTKGEKPCSIYAAYFSPANTQIIIGCTEHNRKEWFFNTIKNMSDEDLRGERNKEWWEAAESLPTRRNRVAGRDLLKKLRELEIEQS